MSLLEAFNRGVFKAVRWVRANPDEVEYQLINFIVAMILCSIMVGCLFGLDALGVIKV